MIYDKVIIENILVSMIYLKCEIIFLQPQILLNIQIYEWSKLIKFTVKINVLNKYVNLAWINKRISLRIIKYKNINKYGDYL